MKVEVPGKLYLCGEYAVLKPGSFALISPTKRKLWIEAKEGKEGRLLSSLFEPISFSWRADYFASSVSPESCLSLFALKFIEGFCRNLTGKHLILQIKIGSDLEEGGIKLGLGSSAALASAMCKAVCFLYGVDLEEEEMLKLALLTHFSWQKSGSGGDVAACIMGPVFYSSFDQNWLRRHLFFDTVFKKWPGLFAQRLTIPSSLSSLALWTGIPASTSSLIRSASPSLKFICRSDRLCLKAREGIIKGEVETVAKAIRLSRYNLESFSKSNRIPLENRSVRKAIRIADTLGVCAKTSGAGGGDCSLAIGKKGECFKLHEAWKQAGFKVLDDVLDFEGEK